MRKALQLALLMLLVSMGEAQAAVWHGVLYDGTSWTVLDAPDAVAQTNAQDIEGNTIVGYYQDAFGTHHGFVYDGNTWTTLDEPGASLTVLTGISGGNIVGQVTDASGSIRGFLYDGNTWTPIQFPGSSFTSVLGIDGANLVGRYNDASGGHGFLYDGAVYTSLDVPGAASTAARGIFGTTIVGHYAEGSRCLPETCHGFVYDSGVYSQLDFPGATRTLAYGIDDGNIVGAYFSAGTGVGDPQHGFLYDGATWTTLDAPGASLTSIAGIEGTNLVGIVIGDVPQPEIDVVPLWLDFGDVELPESNVLIVTISNVGTGALDLESVGLETNSSPDFAITTAPVLPSSLPPGASADVGITYTPTLLGDGMAELEIRSNDWDEGLVTVQLSGAGVAVDAPPAEQVAQILDFIDASVAEDTLEGSGPGNSGPGRLSALANQIEAAGDLIDLGMIDDACGQLLVSLARTDGVFPPPDFVEGDAAEMLALLIEITRTSLSCD